MHGYVAQCPTRVERDFSNSIGWRERGRERDRGREGERERGREGERERDCKCKDNM